MSYRLFKVLFILITFLAPAWPVSAQEEAALEPDAIIQKILAVESKQRSEIQNVTFDAEYVEKESDGKGG